VGRLGRIDWLLEVV
jgi:hypothetical protein